MAQSLTPSIWDVDSSDVYSWFSEKPRSIETDKDLTSQTKQFLKEKGLSAIDIWTNSGRVEKVKQIVKKVYSAYSFVQVANALREDPRLREIPPSMKERVTSSFAKAKISEVFDLSVRRDRILLFPGLKDLDTFSAAWEGLEQYNKNLSVGFDAIQRIVDLEVPVHFPAALDLYKLARDPRLQTITADQIAQDYPFLRDCFNCPLGVVIERLLKGGQEHFPACIQDCVTNKTIIKAALLIKLVDFSASRFSQETILRDISTVVDHFDALQRLFSEYTEADIQQFLKLFQETPDALVKILSEDHEMRKKFVIFGMLLDQTPIHNLDHWNLSLLSDAQREIWKYKDRIISKATHVLQAFVDQIVQEERVLDHLNIQERVEPYIKDRDAQDVTAQFHKDGHRYGQLILAGPNGATLLPGKNPTCEAVKPTLLANLRKFATNDDIFDPILFATLQEAVLQNLEKVGSEQRVRFELLDAFGREVHAFIPIMWRKECVKLLKVDASHFVASQEYLLVTMNQHTGFTISRRIRVVYPIDNENQSWIIHQPRSFCVPNEASPLIAIGEPVELPLLVEVPIEIEKPK